MEELQRQENGGKTEIVEMLDTETAGGTSFRITFRTFTQVCNQIRSLREGKKEQYGEYPQAVLISEEHVWVLNLHLLLFPDSHAVCVCVCAAETERKGCSLFSYERLHKFLLWCARFATVHGCWPMLRSFFSSIDLIPSPRRHRA